MPETKTKPKTDDPNPQQAPAPDPLKQAELSDPLDKPSWILPTAPAGYGGPGVINPYSNVNPLNPVAAEMEAQAASAPASMKPEQLRLGRLTGS